MSIARKILSNTIWQIVGKLLLGLVGLAVIKVTTTYLSVGDYGEYILIYEYLAFFGIAADLGLFTIAVKEMSEDEKKIPIIIGNVLSLRTILVFLTMLASIIIVYLIPNYQDTKIPLGVAVASLTVVLTILNGTITSVLQTKLKMHIASLTPILGKIISLAFMIYVVFYGFPKDTNMGFFMLLGAGIAGNLVTLLATNYYVKKITPLEYRLDFGLWKDVLIKSVPYGFALILGTIYFRIDTILLSILKTQEAVGIYGVAMRMLEQLTILPLFFMNSVLPVLTKAVKQKTERYKLIIKYSFDFLASAAVPIVVGGFVLAYPLVFIVSTPDFLSRIKDGFYGSDITLQILIFSLLFQFLSVLFSFILITVNKQYKLLYINGACVILKIIANIIIIPIYGVRGAAITSVITELLILIGVYWMAKRSLDFSISLKNTAKIIFSALTMGAVVYLLQPITYKFMQNWGVLLLIAIAVVVYGAMLFITKAIDKEKLSIILKGDQYPQEEKI